MRLRNTVTELSRLQHALRRELWFTVLGVLLLVAIAFALAFHFVQPAPPSSLVMTTGPQDGGYHRAALRYQQILARDGVRLELRPSQGSLENVTRLTAAQAPADVGFVQGGTVHAVNTPELVSLGTLYYEPLWVFHRGAEAAELSALRGKRIAIGPDLSGVHALGLQLLAVNDVVLPPTELLPLAGLEAADALIAGDIDAALFVAPADSPAVERLLQAQGIRLLSLERAEAYVRRFPYLSRLTLPRGAIDFAGNVPAHDVNLLAPTTHLLVRKDLHPALAYLLMRAAAEVHSDADLFSKRGQFPTAADSDFPLSPEAKRYYASGSPFLQRYLPYWAANLVDRMWVMLLPVLAVLVPLGRIVPALYSWRNRSQIGRAHV